MSARLKRCWAIAALALAGQGAAAQPHAVHDPHYGDVLFYFYQDRYFSALTSLMVSQHFERVPLHADEAEVLRGGLFLSYGLHREAGEIFAKLLDQGAAPAVRDRAWYYLAKIRYQRGLYAPAQEALARIEGTLPGELQEDRVLLQANVLMARADYAGAAAFLKATPLTAGAGLYARYNLGVALIKSSDAAQGRALLDEIGRAPAGDEESRALRDKANLALGFAALRDDHAQDAFEHIERVRLTGLQANQALLGYGWAASALKQHEQALVSWNELAQRDMADPAVLEAKIARPSAYAELGDFGLSLQGYEQALADFERENASLDASIAAIRSGALLNALQAHDTGGEMGWFWNIRELPALPHGVSLAPLVAQNDFQEAYKNHRDLQFLAHNLQDWAAKLGTYTDMLANRQLAYTQRVPKVLAQASASGLPALQQRRDALERELASAQTQADGMALADAKQRALLERLEQMQATLAQSGDAAPPGAREKHRLASGVLRWELAQAYPERMWRVQKNMRDIDAELAQAQRREAAIAQAQRDEPARFERFRQRIAELDRRVQALTPRIAALSLEQQRELQDMAVAQLTRQKERLATYTVQARFAVAQLIDRAAVQGNTRHALPR